MVRDGGGEMEAMDGLDSQLDAETGFVDLVGAGPGDPDLITRKGMAALGLAQVVVYDHLVHPRLLDLAPPDAELIFAGKSRGKCALKQDQINALLVEIARDGRRVVRLKGGDPYVFGRGAEEAEHLVNAGIPFRVVPGVTAGVGVTSYAGIPVTHRGFASAVTFVTGHEEPGTQPSRVDWRALAALPGTLVAYMGVGRLASICEALIQGGRESSTEACVIQNGTLNSQRTVVGTLASLPGLSSDAAVAAPALLVVGQVVSRRESLSWFENRPLFGQSVVVTRPAEEGGASISSLEALGAEVLLAPTVQILPVESFSEIDGAIARLPHLDWVVFTSANGVNHLLKRVFAGGRDARAFGRCRIAAIGPRTADALAPFGLRADLVPKLSRSEGLAEELLNQVRGKSVLLARADRGRVLLDEEFRKVASVEHVTVYRNVDSPCLPPGLDDRIASGTIDWITITSSAIVERLFELLSARARARVGETVKLASLSPLTTAAANRLGWKVEAEAETTTWEGLVRVLERHKRSTRV